MKTINKTGLYIDGGYLAQIGKYYKQHPDYKTKFNMVNFIEFIETLADNIWGDGQINKITRASVFRYRDTSISMKNNHENVIRENGFDDVLRSSGFDSRIILSNRGSIDYQTELMVNAMSDVMSGRVQRVILIAAAAKYKTFVSELVANDVQVLLPYWEYEYDNKNDQNINCTVSSSLILASTNPLSMVDYIDGLDEVEKELLFMSTNNEFYNDLESEDDEIHYATIYNVVDTYAFAKHDGDDLFVHVNNMDKEYRQQFDRLQVGDEISYKLGMNERGLTALCVRVENSEEVVYQD